ncbi:reverse transcriptase/maturase family protein [uncultured Parasphingopyxis sp.]|uniref:reverse transcriptase/maturase family protein n=1 Tax=uncultured Parasphingopyxis sp. TaxID=1547918 RepID=UPI00261D7F3E|nr:reverse transcriptase/maturase family protein [uncultured Parasphingopyxis sp.]
MTDFSAFVRKHGNLTKAWQTIKTNGRRSSSPYITDDIEKFSEAEKTNIRSISARIQHGTYEFSPAKGVALEKPNKPGSIRPIVIPRATDRVVQRCILDALVSDDAVRKKAFQPFSFGGVPKVDGASLAGVPAAVNALLQKIGAGGTHVIVADISGFFTRIKKPDAVEMIRSLSTDEKFASLFQKAISVDLENCERIWRYKDQFPYGDVGVGQGVCLSPFLGNLVLADFDEAMNEGDCACIRYVDDIIIIAPSGKAASARYRRAKKMLSEKGMEFSSEKSDKLPCPVEKKFEYLGIEFQNGRIRPSSKSRKSILRRTNEVAAKSLQALKSAKKATDFNIDYSIPRTQNKISGMARGWAHHYTFCNDLETVKNVDRNISTTFLNYSAKAVEIAQGKIANNQPDLASAFLGYRGIVGMEFKPLHWPKLKTG